ncbi:unnamed protein product, partial [Mesorhabditis belari]|uniref:Protein kinase domain-containing protein n=1 Tax=Mesorhabditis belari TaxID=2138241 RepID=A0AAF3FAK7_9BILA
MSALQSQGLQTYDVVFPIIRHSEVRKLRELGAGTFGKVYQGFSHAVGNVAIKVCGMEDQKKLVQEVIRTLRYGAAHPNIVKVFGYFDDPRYGLSLVLEYMSGGSLQDVACKRKDLIYYVDHIVSWMYQVTSAVAHMHKCNVLHRDLKPDNILMNELYTTVKICDLGESRVLASNGEDMTTRVGSYLFMAPEVMTSHQYDSRVDVFSLGMVFWMMFARRLPTFIQKYKTPVAFIVGIQNGERPSELPILKVFNDLIQTCMAGNPEDRLHSDKLRDFCVELIEKFPHGQHFLITMPESDRLYEPINVRGDVYDSMTALIDNPLQTVAPTKYIGPPLQPDPLPHLRPIEVTPSPSPIHSHRNPSPQPPTEKQVPIEPIEKMIDEKLEPFRTLLETGAVTKTVVLTTTEDGHYNPYPSTLTEISDVGKLEQTLIASRQETLGELKDVKEYPEIHPEPPVRTVHFTLQNLTVREEEKVKAPEPDIVSNVQILSPSGDILKTAQNWYVKSTKIEMNHVQRMKERYMQAAGIKEEDE